MKVHILRLAEQESQSIIGVFATREQADAVKASADAFIASRKAWLAAEPKAPVGMETLEWCDAVTVETCEVIGSLAGAEPHP